MTDDILNWNQELLRRYKKNDNVILDRGESRVFGTISGYSINPYNQRILLHVDLITGVGSDGWSPTLQIDLYTTDIKLNHV